MRGEIVHLSVAVGGHELKGCHSTKHLEHFNKRKRGRASKVVGS